MPVSTVLLVLLGNAPISTSLMYTGFPANVSPVKTSLYRFTLYLSILLPIRKATLQKGDEMDKIIFADKTGFEIKEGASLGNVVARVESFADLQGIADALIKAGNLKTVQFSHGDEVNGEYTDLTREGMLFTGVDLVDGNVEATFSLREKTEVEKRLDAIEEGQNIQDGAIADLGDVVSTIAEGGAE